jgi:hypothetical protein
MTKRSQTSLPEKIALIRFGRGCLKRKSTGWPFSKTWAEYKEQERQLDDRLIETLATPTKKK